MKIVIGDAGEREREREREREKAQLGKEQ